MHTQLLLCCPYYVFPFAHVMKPTHFSTLTHIHAGLLRRQRVRAHRERVEERRVETRKSFRSSAGDPLDHVVPHKLGRMQHKCIHCGALLWKEEKAPKVPLTRYVHLHVGIHFYKGIQHAMPNAPALP